MTALLVVLFGSASQSFRLSAAGAATTRGGLPAGLAQAIHGRLGAGPLRLNAASGGWATTTTPETTITNAIQSGADLGLAVAVSADGRTALVGAPGGANPWPKITGLAYVFHSDSPGSWASSSTPVATLEDSNAPLNGGFAGAVALSADGTTAFIQGGDNGQHKGPVDVFHVASADAWASTSTPTATLTDSGNPLYGPVAVSTDGTTALVGADVFHVDNEEAWTTVSTPTARLGPTGDQWWGRAVALSADGTTALVAVSPNVNPPGAAYIFHVASADAWVTMTTPTALLGLGTGTGQLTLGAAISGDGSTALLTIGGHGVELFHASSEASWTSSSTPTAQLNQPGPPETQAGLSLALSSDGTTALIGGHAQAPTVNYVYSVPSADAWATTSTPAATLRTGAPKAWFGGAVSLTPDGTTAVIGGPSADSMGAAFTFHVGAESAWSGHMAAGAMLSTGLGALGAGGLGYSVALSADGTTALVGGPFRDGGAGSVFVFQSSSADTWATDSTTVAALLNGGDFADGAFGSSVALSADGTTALIGAPTENGLTGAAYVFHVSSETAWASSSAPTARLSVGGGAAGDDFGYSVALAADGKTALVGGWGVAKRAGAAYVFHVSAEDGWGSTATPAATLSASGGRNVGRSVALSGDGATALVGAPIASGTGAAYVFSAPSADAWTTSPPAATLTSGATTARQHFGAATALSSDGATALIGADGDARTAGAVYVFHVAAPTSWATSPSPAATLTSGPRAAGDGVGRSVALSSDGATALVGAIQPSYPLANGAEAAYIFTAPSADAWSTSSTPAALASNKAGMFDLGRSVSLSSDGTTALVGAPRSGSTKAGAADVFATVPEGAGSPSKLAFTDGVPDGPLTEFVDNAFATWVSVEDASGGPAVGLEPDEISLEITPGTGNPSAQLHCNANPAPVIAGTAFFFCWIDKGGTGYTLTAEAAGLTSAVFPSFNVVGTNTYNTLTSSANPALVGQSVTYTSTTWVGAGTLSPKLHPAGGTVQFKDLTTNTVIAGCGAIPVSVSTGIATCATAYPAPAKDNILLTYSGTADFGLSLASLQQGVVASLAPPPVQRTLERVPLQKAQLGSAGASLALAHDSGAVSNNVATSGSVTGKTGALTDLNRINGFTLDYGDPFSSATGVREILTNLELYKTAADAKKGLAFWEHDDTVRSAYLAKSLTATGSVITVPAVGTQHQAWLETIGAHFGNTQQVSILDERVVDGRYVFDVRVAATTASAAKTLAPQLAKQLDARLRLARAGKLHSSAPSLPPKQNAGPPAGGPDLSTFALQTPDFGFGGVVHIQQNAYLIDPQASSDYQTIFKASGPTLIQTTQQTEWYASTSEATLAASYNAALAIGRTAAGITKGSSQSRLDLADVGDNAWATIVSGSPPSHYFVVISLSRGKATDIVTAESAIPLSSADVRQLAQAAANRLDAALPEP